MSDTRELLINTIKERSCKKRNVFENTITQFEDLKSALKEFADELDEKVHAFDKRLEVKFEVKNDNECRLTMAGDVLVFYMHSNVFRFDPDHHVWTSSYVKEDESRGYCGTIHIYNFLADSFRLNRRNDLGFMIGRVFINEENHFLVEGRKQMGYLYNDFVNNILDHAMWRRIMESALLYSLDFDLQVPPYDQVDTTTVQAVNNLASDNQTRTAKRFGFQFASDRSEEITS